MRTRAYLVGVTLQGLLLGMLLFLAITSLIATASGARLFRYQAF